MINSSNIKKLSWTLFAILVLFMAIGPSNLAYFWPAFFGLSLLAFCWTLYLVYVCESFTIYMTSLLATGVGIFSILSCTAAYLAAARFLGEASAAAFLLGFIPAGVTCLAYWLLAKGKPSFHPFEYEGIKVRPRSEGKQKVATSYNPVLIAGITTLAASVFTNMAGALTAGMVGMFGLMATSVTLLFYARHTLRGLRILRAQEKAMPVPYTFMQIDDIRQARSRWWLSRLFNRLVR